MKKILIGLVISIFVSPCFAYSWGDLQYEVKNNVKVTVAQNATPSYFYNLKEGRSEVGATTDVIWYRFLSGTVGYATGYEDKARGTVILGGSFHADKFVAQVFPKWTTSTQIASFLLSPGIKSIWDKLYVGVYVGSQLTDENFTYGLQSGLEFKF